jgi:hypothetical protein
LGHYALKERANVRRSFAKDVVASTTNVLQTALSAAALALAMSFVATQASATIVDVTYTGTVISMFDQFGFFGSQSLVGYPYTATYRFDTSLGGDNNSPNSNYLYGGSFFGIPSPSLGALVTINGHTLAIGGNYAFDVLNYSWPGQQSGEAISTEASIDGLGYSADRYVWQNIVSLPGSIPIAIDAPFTYSVAAGDQRSGAVFDSFPGNAITGNLLPSSVTYAIEEAPEPPALVLMASGLGALLWLVRKQARRRAAV